MVYPEVGALRQVRGDPVPARHELVVMVKLENKNKLQRFIKQNFLNFMTEEILYLIAFLTLFLVFIHFALVEKALIF